MKTKPKNLNPQRLVWLDLEMTGLNEKTCAILQAAMIITDMQLNELACTDLTIWQPESLLTNMVPVVKNMHTHNGLLKKVRASDLSLLEAEQQLMEVLTEHVNYQKGHLAGNTVYVDRIFLREQMPSIENYLHYRQLDVSSIKILCQEWYKIKAPKKESTHTALEDIRQSIDELKYFKEHCFKLP